MTRKEAIEIFKNMLDAWDNYYTIAQSDKKREAVWLAISSLETDEIYQLEYERTTKNDSSELEKNSKKLEKGTTKNDLGVDCISRQAVLEQAYAYGNGLEPDGYCVNVEDIQALPPVTPQPRRGHWVYTPQRRMVDETDDGCVYETDYRCSCSECGGDFGFARVEDSFCKYCGADMRGEE